MKVFDRLQHLSNKPLRSAGENFDFSTVSYRVEFKRKLTTSNFPSEVKISLETSRARRVNSADDLISIEESATSLRPLLKSYRHLF